MKVLKSKERRIMRRSFPRLPNGLGHIKYLGEGRSNPYAVLPPVYENGYKYGKALCYVPDWYTAFAVLMSYKAGTYHPGDEIELARKMHPRLEEEMSDLAKRIIADYQIVAAKRDSYVRAGQHTFYSVYESYMESRFGEYAPSPYSENTVRMYKSNIHRWESIYNKAIEEITVDDLQNIINSLADQFKRGTCQNALSVCSVVFSHAISRGYVDKSPVTSVKIPYKAGPTESSLAYTDEHLEKIWRAAAQGDRVAIEVIEQVYTGFRVGAMYDLVLDFDKDTVYGGVKTGKRLIPLHPFVREFFRNYPRPPYPRTYLNTQVKNMCSHLDIPPVYTTHSARHTFKRLCDKYGVNQIASRIMMGHSTGKDVHDRVYTHWEIEDLRKELLKIPPIGTKSAQI